MQVFRNLTLIFTLLTMVLVLPNAVVQTSETVTFTSCDGRLAFEYPSDWFVAEQAFELDYFDGMEAHTTLMDGIVLASVEEAINMQYADDDLLGISIQYGQLEAPRQFENPYEWALETQFPDNSREYELPLAITIQDEPAARMNFVYTYQGETRDFIRIYMWLPDNYQLTVEAVTLDPTRYEELEFIVFDLLETVSFMASGPDIAPEGWLTYFEDNCRFRFDYPSDWVTLSRSNQTMVFNSDDARESYLRRHLDGADELAIKMITPDEVNNYFMGEIDAEVATADEILTAYAALEELMMLSEPEAVEIGEHAALQVDIPYGVLMVTTVGEGEYIIFAARTGADGFNEFQADVMTIAESIAWRAAEEEDEE